MRGQDLRLPEALDPQRCSGLNGEDRRRSPCAQYLNTRGAVADDPRLLDTVRVHPRPHGAVPLLRRPPPPRTSDCGGKTCLPVLVTVTEYSAPILARH